MIGFHRLFHLAAVLLSLLSTQAYTSRMEDRGYSSAPDEDNVAGVDCMVNEAGFFGTIKGAANEELIEFKYQLETNQATQATVEDILESLERAYLDKILPVLFSSECDMRRQLQVRRRLEVIGATVNPEDVDLKIPCKAYTSGNGCHQIDGKMYVYTDGGPSGLRKAVLKELQQSMDNGDFNSGVHVGIANVTYLEITTDGLQADNQNTGPTSGAERRLRPPFYAIIAVGGVMMVVAGVIWSRRRRHADEASALTDETSTLPGVTVSESQEGAVSGEVKPEGDSTAIETTLDFSSIRED